MSIGWIKLHRSICDNWISQDPNAMAVWVRILVDANFEDKTKLFNGCKVTIKRGQLIFGLNAFSIKTGVSVAKLRRIIDMLESDGMISRQKTNKYSVITVVSYDQYQVDDKQTTSKTQADDNQIATPKEVKKDKKERTKAAPVPYQSIVDIYNEQCTNLENVSILTDARKRKIKQFWNADDKHKDLDFYKRYFSHINTIPFLTGQVDGKTFKADLAWLMNLENLAKILEKKYND